MALCALLRDPETGEWHVGLEWQEPRDVRQVVVRYAGSSDVPPHLRVQYWHKNWPTPAPERRPGAGRGWIGRDDPWHGAWTTVRAEKEVDGNTCTFTFDPIDLPELGGREMAGAVAQLNEAEHYLARFRRTLKVRLVSGGGEQPVIAALHTYSGTRWREGWVDVRFGIGQQSLLTGVAMRRPPMAISWRSSRLIWRQRIRWGRTTTGVAGSRTRSRVCVCTSFTRTAPRPRQIAQCSPYAPRRGVSPSW